MNKNICIYGDPVSGKSTLAAWLASIIAKDGTAMISTDGNIGTIIKSNFIKKEHIFRIEKFYIQGKNEEKVVDFVKLKNTLKNLKLYNEKNNNRFKTLIIDTIDDIRFAMEGFIGNREGKTFAKLGMAKWGYIDNEWKGFLSFLNSLNMRIIFIGHAKTIEDNSGIQRTIPSLQKRHYEMLKGKLKALFYLKNENSAKTGNKGRVLYLNNDFNLCSCFYRIDKDLTKPQTEEKNYLLNPTGINLNEYLEGENNDE